MKEVATALLALGAGNVTISAIYLFEKKDITPRSLLIGGIIQCVIGYIILVAS